MLPNPEGFGGAEISQRFELQKKYNPYVKGLDKKAQSGKLFNTDNQLSSNLATQVFQDKSGFIWIATRNGLNTYDGYHIKI